MACQWIKLMVVTLTLLSADVFASFTFPKCSQNGKGCCPYGKEMMKNRGYVMLALDDGDMVITCRKGLLRCSYENPEKHGDASAPNVTCPDFTRLMESRTEITYLEGAPVSSSDKSTTGTVKAPEV